MTVAIAELEASLRGSGTVTCACKMHREKCHFGRYHSWSMATVVWQTGVSLERPTFHCFVCDSWCLLED